MRCVAHIDMPVGVNPLKTASWALSENAEFQTNSFRRLTPLRVEAMAMAMEMEMAMEVEMEMGGNRVCVRCC